MFTACDDGGLSALPEWGISSSTSKQNLSLQPPYPPSLPLALRVALYGSLDA